MSRERKAALQRHAISVPVADRSSADSPFTERLASASIVGLGEATHGTREFFQHKARIARSLVVDAGFRTVAFEVDAVEAMALDAFVDPDTNEAPNSASDALAGLSMWQWQTEAVARLLDWLRSFNHEQPVEERVRVRGVDLSVPEVPAHRLLASLDDAETTAVDDVLSTVADAELPEEPAAREERLDALEQAAGTVADWLEANASDDPASTANRLHLCRLVEQHCEWHRVRHEHEGPHPSGMAKRDELMAENAEWALERDTGDGVVLWAHNAHIQRGTFDDGRFWTDATTMGKHLESSYGGDYTPVGFDFLRGSFRAVDADSGDAATFTVGDPLDGTATASFSNLEPPFALDLAVVADTRLGTWLHHDPGTRYVGSVYDPESEPGERYARTDLPASYDWLVVIGESSPTRPVEEG